jgi:large subunit ribosomal protein L25
VLTISATVRPTDQSVKALRRQGIVPAVVYGRNIGNVAIQINAQELDAALRKQPTNIPFRLTLDGEEHNVMVYELQRDPLHGRVLHADFKQISMDEKVHTSVPIVLQGEPEDGVASLVRHSLEVVCKPMDIPESFIVNVEGMSVGDMVLVKDLDIPDTITVGLDEMEVVANVLASKAASEESLEAKEAAENEAAKAPAGK